MFLFARTLLGRRVERRLAGAPYRQPDLAPVSMFSDVDLDKAVEELIKNGVWVGLRLPDEIVEQILDFAEKTPCFSRDSQQVGFLPRNVAAANAQRERDVVAGYYFEAVENLPAIEQIAGDATLLSIAAAYIGQEPVLIRIRMWWSFPATRVSDADLHAAAQDKFHRYGCAARSSVRRRRPASARL